MHQMLKKKIQNFECFNKEVTVIDFCSFFGLDFVLTIGFALRPTGVSLSLSNYKQAKNA